jgi:hypothetical protein
VRRESDNHERDFLAKEVANGTLENFVNTQTVLPLDLQALTNDGRTGSVIGADAAYSLRNLSSSYTGNVVDVRRSSDDTVQGFKASEIVSGGAIETFCGTGDGFVSKWYDQSGNSNHAVQTDASQQPKIVNNGSLVSNGIDFAAGSGATFNIPTNIISSINSASAFVVAKSDTTASSRTALSLSRNNPDFRFYNPIIVSSNFNFGYQDSATKISLGSADSNKHLFTAIAGSSNAEAFLDGTSKGTVSSAEGKSVLSSGGIGSINDGVLWNGQIEEILVYASDQTDNRTALEANIAEHYSISGVPTATDTVNGFVETWYDQSGNGSDATQTTITKQPKIVDGGSLVTGGIDFLNGTSTSLETNNSDICNVPQLSIFTVLTPHTAQSQTQAFSCGAVVYNSTGYGGWRLNFNGYSDDADFQTQAKGSTPFGSISLDVTSSECLVAYVATFPNATGSVNGGTAVTTSNMVSPNQNGVGTRKFRIGGQFTFRYDANYTKPINEIIIYTTDQSANRPAIEANIKNQYNLT